MKTAILKIVCLYCDITEEQFYSNSRSPAICTARRIFTNLVKELMPSFGAMETMEWIRKSRYMYAHYNDVHDNDMKNIYYREDYEMLKELCEKERRPEFEKICRQES